MQTQKRQIYMVYQSNPFRSEQGGGVRYAQNLTNALAEQGMKLTFLGAGGAPQEEGNVRYIPITKNPNNTILFMLALLWARIRYIGFSDAIVHVHRLYYTLPFMGPGIKCVVTLHGRTFTVFPERFGKALSLIVFPVFRFIEHQLLKRTDRLVAVSQDVLDQFSYRHGEIMRKLDVRIIPSMVDFSKFKPEPHTYFEEQLGSAPVCLFVGRMAAVKDIPLLLESWNIVASHCPDAQLILAGDGELREEIASWVEEMGLAGSITMVGQIASDVIPTVIASAKLIVLTSKHEASPTVVKEALSCGVPVVCTPVGDVESIVVPGNTGRIATAVPSALAEAIVDVLGWTTSQQDIAKAAAPVLEQYSPKLVSALYIEVYRSLVL